MCDPGLTELGIRQAAKTAEHLASLPITHIYCSPFLRALETARPIAAASGLTVHIRADIFEQGGCYSGHEAIDCRGEPGMGASQLRQRYPGWHVDASISESGWWGRDYETMDEARARARKVARWMAEDLTPNGGLRVFVIHADFKRLLVESLLSQSLDGSATIDESLYNTGITHAELVGEKWKLHRLNCVKHLDRELISL